MAALALAKNAGASNAWALIMMRAVGYMCCVQVGAFVRVVSRTHSSASASVAYAGTGVGTSGSERRISCVGSLFLLEPVSNEKAKDEQVLAFL